MKKPSERLRPALWVLGILLFLALARDFLANGRPLWCRIGGETYWPGLRTVLTDPDQPYGVPVLDSLEQNNAWQTYPYDAAVFAPIPFSPGHWFRQPGLKLLLPGSVHPGFPNRFRHWLGTDEQGRDVAAGLVAGARIAVLTGALAMALAFGIGLTLGATAGFFGDDRLRVRRGRLWLTALGLPAAVFYAFVARAYTLESLRTGAVWLESLAIFAGVLFFFNMLGWLLGRLPYFNKKIVVPADLLIMRLAEVFNAIPRLILLIVVAAMAPKQSLWLMIALIGAMSWTGVARFVRAELLRVRELDYVTAARGLGYPDRRILLRHALPNAMRPALIAFAFGVAGAIMLEATLTFLGFGGNEFRGISWGSLLQSARNPQAWWVAAPAGIAIAITVLTLNSIGEALSEARR